MKLTPEQIEAQRVKYCEYRLKRTGLEPLRFENGEFAYSPDDGRFDIWLAAIESQPEKESATRIADLEAMLRKKLDLIKCGIGGNYSGDPYDNILYTEAYDLLFKVKVKE